jgi:hypothetical protein
MYVMEAVELVESPLEFWQRIGKNDGAWLRSFATRLAAGDGPLRALLCVMQPALRRGRSIRFDCEVRPLSGPGGAMFVAWDAHLARLEGELEVVPNGLGNQLRLCASYEPPWAATLTGRSALRPMAEEAVRDFLEQAASAGEQAAIAARTRRRVLIEDEDLAWQRLVVELTEAGEFEFDGCRGPLLARGGCPALRGESCPKVEWADVILNSLNGCHPANAKLLETLKQGVPDASLTVIAGEPATHCLTRNRDLQSSQSLRSEERMAESFALTFAGVSTGRSPEGA